MSNTMLSLKSKDNQIFTIEQNIAIQSITIKNLVDDDCASSTIPLPNVDSKILAMVIEFLKKQSENAVLKTQADAEKDKDKENDLLKQVEKVEEETKNFVKEFGHDYLTLFDVIKAANYLDIKELMAISCQEAADRIKDLKSEEVREIFKIENDYTPHEEEVVRNEHAWAYEL